MQRSDLRASVVNGTLLHARTVVYALATILVACSVAGTQPSRADAQQFSAGPLVEAPLGAEEVTVQGVVRDAAGVPVYNAQVMARLRGSGLSAGARTSTSGEYSFSVPAGEYDLEMEYRHEPSSPEQTDGAVYTEIASVNVAGDLTENWKLPQIGSVTVSAVDANGEPAPQYTFIEGKRDPSFEGLTGETEEGTRVVERASFSDGHGSFLSDVAPEYCQNRTTVPEANCTFRGIVGTHMLFKVRPPNGIGVEGVAGEATPSGNTVTARLAYYARVPSRGTVGGVVELFSPPSTELSGVRTEAAGDTGFPEGYGPVIGILNYTVTQVAPGASADVSIELPAGSNPTKIFKIVNGDYVDITSLADIAGSTVTLHLRDGGLGDEDGEANGMIVDPVVPARAERFPQAITLHSQPPTSPNVGSVYRVDGSATSGLSVNFSVDHASTPRACTASGSTVSFTGPGTCYIDANQAGNAKFAAAPTVRQMINVVAGKAATTDTVTFVAPRVVYGSEQTDTAQVAITAAGGGVIPTGKLAVKAGTKTLCTATIVYGTGSCSMKSTILKPGSYQVTGVYTETTRFGGSTSDPVTLVITQDPTSTSLTLSTKAVSYGSEQVLVAAVAVTTPNGVPATGSVKVKAGPKAICTATLKNGVGSCSPKENTLLKGSYTVEGVYASSTAFVGSSSTGTTLVVQ